MMLPPPPRPPITLEPTAPSLFSLPLIVGALVAVGGLAGSVPALSTAGAAAAPLAALSGLVLGTLPVLGVLFARTAARLALGVSVPLMAIAVRLLQDGVLLRISEPDRLPALSLALGGIVMAVSAGLILRRPA